MPSQQTPRLDACAEFATFPTAFLTGDAVFSYQSFLKPDLRDKSLGKTHDKACRGDEVVVDTGNVFIAERVKAVTGDEMACGATDAFAGDKTGN